MTGGAFWQKIKEAKTKGITTEEFESIENLEAAIAHHQNKVDEYEEEIKKIEKMAELRLEHIGM